MDGTCLPNAFCIKRLYAKLNTIKLVAANSYHQMNIRLFASPERW